MRFPVISCCLCVLLGAICRAAEPAAPLQLPPPAPVTAYQPLPNLPPTALDEVNNGVGVAQQVAREKQVQGRVLWIDATANLDRINTAEKIHALVQQIKSVGFNTIVMDVKPIVGLTLYPSKYAAKLTEWKGGQLPLAFDPLAEMLKDAHAAGLGLVVNLNVFSEGHRLMSRGPGFDHPEWQSVLYEPQLVMSVGPGAPKVPITRPNGTEFGTTLTLYLSFAEFDSKPGMTVVVVDDARRALLIADGGACANPEPSVPRGGAVLVGDGKAGEQLRQHVQLGVAIPMETVATYMPSGQSGAYGVPLWVNPHAPGVQQRMLDIITEVVTNYQVDGVIFDDRLRFAGINADFSDSTRRAFEQYVGKPLTWPDDVLRYEISFPSLSRRMMTGPYYDTWVLWRAMAIRNWLARAVNAVKAIRATATVSVYVGSWYGEYSAYGSNWAADDFQAGFRFLTDTFRQTGYAQLLDWVSTGCYYTTPTLADAYGAGTPPGTTVEAAAQLSNRCVNSTAWVYAGISLDKFDKNPDGLARALQAATAATQGVMVFDLSHRIDQFWPVFQQAFQQPARAPHAVPGLLNDVRAKQAVRRQAGITDPPVIILNGAAGTGL